MLADMSREQQSWTVGEVADDYGITVRTLHHYDSIGLLEPSERSLAGYRLYTRADLARLARIVVYRRLEVPLEQIRELLDGDTDAVEQLKRQREAVLARMDELASLASALEKEMTRVSTNQPATREEMQEIFGNGFSDEYRDEAAQRWGDTTAWKQSSARTTRYTKADWEQVKTEADAVNAAFVAALQAGLPADSVEAMDAAESHRRHIESRFYDLDHTFHRNLGDMYVSDPRFTATYEQIAPGLAQYVRDAIHANAERHSS